MNMHRAWLPCLTWAGEKASGLPGSYLCNLEQLWPLHEVEQASCLWCRHLTVIFDVGKKASRATHRLPCFSRVFLEILASSELCSWEGLIMVAERDE